MESAIITIATLASLIDMKREGDRRTKFDGFNGIFRIINYRAIVLGIISHMSYI